jgi:hypothetical protein
LLDAQERSLFSELLATVQPKQVWIADRNFCTRNLLLDIDQRGAFFVIREHKGLAWQALEPLKSIETIETGEVFEQGITIDKEQGEKLVLRRIVAPRA